MAKSDARFEYQAKLSRTDHDLSQKFGFTTAPGILSPIFADIATPGDSYYIKHDLSFMRTAPLLAPSMIDVKVHFESFFVPMQMIYQPFENSMFSLTEILSSNYVVTSFRNQALPRFSANDVFDQIGAGSNNEEPFARLDAFRLFDLLDMPTVGFAGKNAFEPSFGTFFPWQLCAYQCIYQYYYRLDDKQQFDHDAFNVDRFYSSETNISANWDVLQKMIKLRYRPWKFDYFTSCYMSPIISNANTQRFLGERTPELDTFGTVIARNINGGFVNVNGQTSALGLGIPDSVTNPVVTDAAKLLNTASIRQMFANEKLAMITGRTKKNYDSQVLAHYGVPVPHDVKHDISFIGHDEFELKVGEVTSLASTDLSPLGDLAGKGWAFGQAKKQHKFTAPCHGVVMTIFSVEPMIRYEGTVQRINFVSSALDIPIPEYDRLGNQPMFYREFDNHDQPASILTDNAGVWKERYYCNKRRYDRVSQAFSQKPTNALQSREQTNVYSAYFVHDTPFTIHPSSPVSYQYAEAAYYINPACLDALMLVSYNDQWRDGGTEQAPTEDFDTYPYLAFARDPFIVDSDLKVKKVSWMSKDGEPIYPY